MQGYVRTTCYYTGDHKIYFIIIIIVIIIVIIIITIIIMCMSHTYRWPYSSKHQATSYSKVLLRILAVPNKQAFWNNAMIPGVSNLLIHILRCLLTVTRASITIGITDITLLQFQIALPLLSPDTCWIFSFSFSATRVSKWGQATSTMKHRLHFFSRTTISGLLWSRLWSVWILKSHSNFTW